MSEEHSSMEELDNVIILEDEEGNPVSMEFLDLIEYEGEEYLVLYPHEEKDQDGEVTILRVAEADDPELEEYLSVEDQETLDIVFEIFKAQNREFFNFAD